VNTLYAVRVRFLPVGHETYFPRLPPTFGRPPSPKMREGELLVK
jgi:hypothetical protein